MEITWDTSVSPSNRTLIQAAIDECLFDFAYIPTAWTVQVNPTAGHAGKFEAVTSTSGPGNPATTVFAPGLFIPGDPLYGGVAFAKECVLHELGHVVTLANLPEQGHRDICTILGIDYATQWAAPGQSWTQMGRESAAEIFKDFYAAPVGGRHFDNRTAHQIDLGGWNWFISVIAQSMQSIQEDVPIVRRTATYSPLEARYDLVVDVYDLPADLYAVPANNDALEVQVLVEGTLPNDDDYTLDPIWNFYFGMIAGLSSWTLADWTCYDSGDPRFAIWDFPQAGYLSLGGSSGNPGTEAVFLGGGFIQSNDNFHAFAYRSSNGDVLGEVGTTQLITNPAWSFTPIPGGIDWQSMHATPVLFQHVGFQLVAAGLDVVKFLVLRPRYPVDIPVLRVTRHKAPSVPFVLWPYTAANAKAAPGSVSPGAVSVGVVR